MGEPNAARSHRFVLHRQRTNDRPLCVHFYNDHLLPTDTTVGMFDGSVLAVGSIVVYRSFKSRTTADNLKKNISEEALVKMAKYYMQFSMF